MAEPPPAPSTEDKARDGSSSSISRTGDKIDSTLPQSSTGNPGAISDIRRLGNELQSLFDRLDRPVSREDAPSKDEKLQPPINFKDCIGRKFSFPYALVKEWKGMEDMIKNAFSHIDVVGSHVRNGHYDLIGPNGEIILPRVWEHVIEPGLAIKMELWPFEKREATQLPPGFGPHNGLPPGFGRRPHPGMPPPGMLPPGRRHGARTQMPWPPPVPLPPTPTSLSRVKLEGVFEFPGQSIETATDDPYSIHLAVFKVVFAPDIQIARIGISYNLVAQPGEDLTGENANDIEVVTTTLFRSKSTKSVFEPVDTSKRQETGQAATHSGGVKLNILGETGVVILLRRRREPGKAYDHTTRSLSVAFDIVGRMRTGMGPEKRSCQTDYNINLDDSVSTRWTPLSWAAAYGWEDGLKLLFQEEQTRKYRQHADKDGRTALSWAAGNGQDLTTKLLVEDEPEADQPDNRGRTPLSWAAGNGHDYTAQILLTQYNKGIKADRRDIQGRSPLTYAAKNGHHAALRVLLQLSEEIDSDCADNRKRTPLSYAAESGHCGIVHALLEHGMKLGRPPNVFVDEAGIPSNSPVYWAARKEKYDVLGILINNESQPPSAHRGFYLHEAAKRGWITLAELLLEHDKVPNSTYTVGDDDKHTMLCVAADNGQTEMVRMLINKFPVARDHQTTASRDTPLILAIRGGYEETVKVLIDAGANTTLENVKGETPLGLARDSNNLAIFSTVLAAADTDGGLAETAEGHLHSDVDNHFRATVADFVQQSGTTKPYYAEYPVDFLLQHPNLRGRIDSSTSPAFRWIHLPANNMRWVEVLMMGHYDNPAWAYSVLKPEHWVKRQHHGTSRTHHHARFMRPHFQGFPSATCSSISANTPEEDLPHHWMDLVLFMPFLHWDQVDLKSKRDQVAELGLALKSDAALNPDQLLTKQYINNAHPLHIRRTLDQYYYHTLIDTSKRDQDQLVTRWQAKGDLDPRVLTMVDQLWLWVLNGGPGKQDTVVTCFPRIGQKTNADKEGVTDVLRCIKLRLLESSVDSAYDLAGLIAATCSRVYLDPASTLSTSSSKGVETTLQFSELYGTEIGHVVQEEAVLFQKFTNLQKEDVANIVEEIQLLSRIKDVLDELNIMAMLFNDQRKVLKAMNASLKSVREDEEGPATFEREVVDDDQPPLPPPPSPPPSSPPEKGKKGRKVGTNANANKKGSLLSWMAGAERAAPIEWSDAEDEQSDTFGTETRDETIDRKERSNLVWGTRHDSGDFSLPLVTLNVSIDEISVMIDRAEKANQALNFLVDLKQKQNSVMDAQESLKMAKETTRQGRVVLIFTLTTIIFLPLSFLTTFLTLDISQFQWNDDGKLDLGYVSYILFPVSSLVSAFLIWIAFKIEYFAMIWGWIVNHTSNTLKAWTKPASSSGVERHVRVPLSASPIATGLSDLEAGVVVPCTAGDKAGDEPRLALVKGES